MISLRAVAAFTLPKNEFLRTNLIFFVGSLLIAFFNYLYYPVLGRMLESEQFGEVQVLVSLFIQATIFLNVLSLLVVNIMTRQEDKTDASSLVELERFALLVGGVLFIALAGFAPLLATAMKFEDSLGFVIIGAVFLVSIPLAFRTAFLRGKNSFGAASLSGIIGSLTKIVFSVVFVVIGWGVFGAIGGILVAQMLAFLYAATVAGRGGYPRSSYELRPPKWSIVRSELRYAAFVFFVSFVVTVMFSIDVVIVKYLFSPQVAGEYAGISTVARIVYFLTVSVAIVLLSAVKPKGHSRDNIRLLTKSLLLTALLGGSATFVFCLFPEFVTHLLMGRKFDTYIYLLPLLSIVMLVVSLANVLTNYLMALRDYTTAYIIAATAGMTALLIFSQHDSVQKIIQDLLWGSVVLLISLMLRAGLIARRSL